MHLRYWHLFFCRDIYISESYPVSGRVMSSNYYVVKHKNLIREKSPKQHLVCIFSYYLNTGSGQHWVVYSLHNGHTLMFWFEMYIHPSPVPIIQATKPTMKCLFGWFGSDPDHSKSFEKHCKWCSLTAIVLESENLDQTLACGRNWPNWETNTRPK